MNETSVRIGSRGFSASSVTEKARPLSGAADIDNYRAHIDGLRAIAILSVVCGHVGVPGFGGGFVGVDVFFVISGYLIIGQIVEALRKGTFSFAGFWARRVLRILPPMLVVLLASTVIASFVLVTPGEFRAFGAQLLYSTLMVVNFYFLDVQGYFDTDAVLKPLLHMWSLAVEEQFYLLAPLILFGFWRLRDRRAAAWIAAAVFALSLVACILLTDPSKNIAFYVVFCRAWEFIAGGAIVFLGSRFAALAPATRDALALGGLGLIAASVVLLRESSLFPSYSALFPVAGTAMVIAALSAGAPARVARILGSPPFVAIGLVSYSWYLWHWPLLSFARIQNFGESDMYRDSAAVLIALAAAAATYVLVERPSRALRHSPLVSRAGGTIVTCGLLLTVALALGSAVHQSREVTAAEKAIPAAMRPEDDGKIIRQDPCWMYDPGLLSAGCRAGLGGKKVVVLLGDSHARMLYPALRRAADASGMALISLWRTGCSPFARDPETWLRRTSRECANYAEIGLRTLRRELPSPPDFLVGVGFWGLAIHGANYAEYRLGKAGVATPPPAVMRTLANDVSTFIDLTRSVSIGKVFLLGPTAEFVRLPVECFARAKAIGVPAQSCNVSRQELDEWVAPADALLRDIVNPLAGVEVVDAMDAFCTRQECSPADAGTMYFTDLDHVSAAGAMRILRTTSLRHLFGPALDEAAMKAIR